MLPILHQSIWRDEAFSLLLSIKPLQEIIHLTAKDASPPLYYFILHYWLILFGNSEVVARVLSILFHIATAFFVFLIAKRLTQAVIPSIIIALCILFNPFLIQYAFEIRGYTMLACITSIALYCSIENKRILAGLFLAIGIFTHNFGIFNAFAFGLWYLYENRRNLLSQKTIEFLFFPSLALLLWESVIWTQWTKVAGGFWIKPVTSSIFLHTFQKFTSGDLVFPTQDLLFMFSFIVVSLSISSFVFRQEKKEEVSLLCLVSYLPLFITYLLSALFTPIYHERYLIASLPSFILLVGYGLHDLYKKNPDMRIPIVVVVAMYFVVLVQSSEYLTKTPTKPAINYAVNQVLSQAADKDIIVPVDVLNFLETKYYVSQSGRKIPVLAYTPDGKIPFYIGAILFDQNERITKYPRNKRIWEITPDGGYRLRKT